MGSTESNTRAGQAAEKNHGHDSLAQDSALKSSIVALLTIAALIVAVYFQFVLHTATVFTHLFYLPIILATYWFGYMGLAVPVILASTIIFGDLWQANSAALGDDLLRSGVFIVVALVMAFLSTRTKSAVKEQRASETRFSALFNTSRDAIMTLEPPDWNFTSGNPATIRMFGCKDEGDFISRGPPAYSPKTQPDGQPSDTKAKAMIMKAMADGINFFEWDHMRLDDQVFPANVLLTRVDIGDKSFLQATVRDITELKKMEETLKSRAAQLEDQVNVRTKELKTRMDELETKNQQLAEVIEFVVHREKDLKRAKDSLAAEKAESARQKNG